jgi:hypothetical protein
MSLKQLPESFNTQASIARNATHRKRIDRIMTWDSDDANAIRHDYMLALTNDAEASLLQSPDASR